MNPVIGNAVVIIEQALALGILCRPVGSIRVGVGEGIEVTRSSYFLHSGTNRTPTYFPEPWELLLDWELTTRDLLAEERRKATEVPW